CSVVRKALEDALTGRLDMLDGTVFPHTCDSMQRLSDIWRLNTKFPFFADIVLPVTLSRESSFRYLVDILRTFRTEIEKGLSVRIDDNDLRRSCALYNDIRSALRDLSDMRAERPAILSGREYATVLKAAMIMDREDFRERLLDLLWRLPRSREETRDRGGPRILLSGGLCDQPDLFGMFDGAGVAIVGDDLCTGLRYADGAINLTGDPVEALAQRYVSRATCPAKHSSITARAEHLTMLARSRRAAGVIFILLKFCEPHAFDYPYLREALEKEGMATLLLELEDRLPPQGQVATRLETFRHLLMRRMPTASTEVRETS
ncbi:MAG: 2-hydroxyacyl-CoA dehydratase, partial [Deltaproteobacteria bacterium]|nr:2-hydroxyacyl-CoA dehydratase [Deltaproteobacteria bacterium]